ncbi:MAG: Ig-like domain-containing protein [Candidatus Limivivens sp.]|nr:Ig-like domain-containing protein [Candidatus Limivivens sp.]
MVPAVKAQAASPKLSSSSLVLIQGQSQTLKVTGATGKITWSSSQKSIASVNSKGKVTAKKKGTAAITAKFGKNKLVCKVTVETPSLNKETLTLNVKGTAQLKLTGTKQKIKWSSSRKTVATVSSGGKVTAKKAGTATITATISGKNIPVRLP